MVSLTAVRSRVTVALNKATPISVLLATRLSRMVNEAPASVCMPRLAQPTTATRSTVAATPLTFKPLSSPVMATPRSVEPPAPVSSSTAGALV